MEGSGLKFTVRSETNEFVVSCSLEKLNIVESEEDESRNGIQSVEIIGMKERCG